MEKQFVKRICDNPDCDSVMLIDPQKANIEETKRWIGIIFTVEGPPNPQNPQAGPTLQHSVKHACRQGCAIKIMKIHIDAPQDTQQKRDDKKPADTSEFKPPVQ
jgi:hypothetical protein